LKFLQRRNYWKTFKAVIPNEKPMRPTLVLIALILFSCQAKKESTSVQEATTPSQQVIDGDYELYYGAVDGGYLYYKLTLRQSGDSLSGSFFSGIYLSKNNQGYYSVPAAMVTSALTGQRSGKNEVFLYLGAPIDTSRMDQTYAFPQPEKIFDTDAQDDSFQSITKVGNDFQWVHNGDTLLFTKVVSAKPQ
jgi:hypothetical protein